MNHTYIKTGDYYLRIETDDAIIFHIFNNDYDDAVNYCQKNNINVKNIKKWIDYSFDE